MKEPSHFYNHTIILVEYVPWFTSGVFITCKNFVILIFNMSIYSGHVFACLGHFISFIKVN